MFIYIIVGIFVIGFIALIVMAVTKDTEKENLEHFNKVVTPVIEASPRIQELEKLNKSIMYHHIDECIKTVDITAQTVSEFKRKTANLPERLFQEDPEFYVSALNKACDNAEAIDYYEEELKKIKFTPSKIANSIEGMSEEEFYKIESEEFFKRKLQIPIKFYVSVMCKFQYHRADELKVGLAFFQPMAIKYVKGMNDTSIIQRGSTAETRKKENLMGVSVTKRIEQISQPRGGYINPNSFEVKQLNDNSELGAENIHSSLVGLAVDYMTRYMLSKDKSLAFDIPLLGAKKIGKEKDYQQLVDGIIGLDDNSITNACKLAGFDVVFRSGIMGYKPYEEINPDSQTIKNIRIMVTRALVFFKEYGPVTKYGFTFEKDGYTETVAKGDGDFLTKNILWDFKVSVKEPTSKHTLQLAMYYIMGKHSKQDCYKDINKIGVFNPRLNKVYLFDMTKLDKSIIETIEKDVICY